MSRARQPMQDEIDILKACRRWLSRHPDTRRTVLANRRHYDMRLDTNYTLNGVHLIPVTLPEHIHFLETPPEWEGILLRDRYARDVLSLSQAYADCVQKKLKGCPGSHHLISTEKKG